MRKPIVAGNWKMFKTRAEAEATAREVKSLLAGQPSTSQVEVVICPPFTAISAVCDVLQGAQIRVGAQNVHWEDEGAYTGEVSTGMLLGCGCDYVILGHSERRQYFSESDETIRRKLNRVLTTELTPILCVGESLEERESGRAQTVILGQMEGALQGLGADLLTRIVVAYEPVWAIGTGKTATPEIADQVHGMIRQLLAQQFGSDAAEAVRILYGGSVKPDNAGVLLGQEHIDGALVGGASLDAASFVQIVKYDRADQG